MISGTVFFLMLPNSVLFFIQPILLSLFEYEIGDFNKKSKLFQDFLDLTCLYIKEILILKPIRNENIF